MNSARLKSFILPSARTVVAVYLLVSAGCAALTADRVELSEADRDLTRALAYYAQGLVFEHSYGAESDASLDAFKDALAIDPGVHRLHQHVALGHLRRGETDKAVAILKRSCRENPNSVTARIDLAAACQIAGDTDAAIENFLAATVIAPSNGLPYLAAARLCGETGDDDAAVRIIRLAHANVDTPAVILAFAYNEGSRYLREGDIERAIPYFSLLAEHTDVRQGRFFHILGEISEQLGNREAALHYFQKAADAASPLPDPFVRIALLHYETNPEAALASLRQGLRVLPDDRLLLSSLAYMLNAEKRFEEALPVFERVAQTTSGDESPLSEKFYLFYGGACEQTGRYGLAEQVFRTCLDKYPKAHEIMNYLAYMWAEQGTNLDEAQQIVQQALELDPGNGAYLDTLGWIFYKQQLYEDALQAILRAMAVVGNDPVIADHLGDVYAAMGKTEKAIEAWLLCLSLEPDNPRIIEKLTATGQDIDKAASTRHVPESD
jgi:tetratricopeptide (TPR) repeat protein